MKKIIMYLSLLCAILPISGCSDNAVGLLDAYYKTASLKSYQVESNLDIELDAELSDEVLNRNKPFNVQSLLNALSDFNLSTSGKRYENSKGEYKGIYKFNITSPDSTDTFTGYEYGDKENFTSVVYIPTLLRALLPAKYEDSRYVNFSAGEFQKFFSEDSPEFAFNGDFLNISKEYGESVIKILLKIFDEIDISDMLSKKNNVYTFTISDAQLKSVMKRIVTEYYENPEFRKNFKDIFDATYEYYKNIYGEDAVGYIFGADITFDPEEGDMEKDLETIAAFEKIMFIGDDGIKVLFKKSNRGYISEIKIDGTIVADSGEFQKLNFGEEFFETERYFFKFNYDWKLSYAGTVKNFNLPEFNSESCVNIFDWIYEYKTHEDEADVFEPELEKIEFHKDYKGNMVLPAEDGSIVFFTPSNMKVHFDITPVIRDGVTYIADTEINKILIWEYLYTEKEDDFYKIEVGRKYPIYVYPDKKEVTKNGYKILINNAPFVENGVLYLPFKDFIHIAYEAEAIWNEDEKSVTVQY